MPAPRALVAALLATAALGAATLAAAEVPRSLIVDFVRETRSEGGAETVQGTLYFRPPDRVLLRVESPVSQIALFEGDTLLIYYPESRRAFRFVSRNTLLVRLSQSFVGALKEDFGLPEAGFTVARTTAAGGLLQTEWSPPAAARAQIGRVLTEHRAGLPVSMEVRDRQGKSIMRATYEQLAPVGSILLPGRTVVVTTGSGGRSVETSSFTNYRLNEPLPEDIAEFALPADVTAKELEW